MMHPNRQRRAFTIVELLVVIGIIALLIAILMPVIHRARQQAGRTACQAQLKNIGAAFRMYLNENKDRYPRAPSLPSVNPDKLPLLTEQLGKYVDKNGNVFQCPADKEIFPVEKISYFYYSELGERKFEQTFFYKVLGNASKVPILWDAANYHGGELPFNWLFADGHVDQFLKKAQ